MKIRCHHDHSKGKNKTSPVKNDEDEESTSAKHDEDKGTSPVKNEEDKESTSEKNNEDKSTSPIKNTGDIETLPKREHKNEESPTLEENEQTLPTKEKLNKDTSDLKESKKEEIFSNLSSEEEKEKIEAMMKRLK